MATVRIQRSDVNALPPVCVHCGVAAPHRREIEFVWHPWWGCVFLRLLGPLGGLILQAHLEKRMKLGLPACPAHQTRAVWQPHAYFAGGAILLFLLGVGGVLLTGEVDRRRLEQRAPLVLCGLAVAAVTYGGVGRIVRTRLVRPTRITEEHLELDGVSEAFARAHHGERVEPCGSSA
jgi:hypothetical protein